MKIRNKSCPICLEHINDRKAAVVSICMHVYCINCIKKWTNLEKRNCPLCNSEFNSWFIKSRYPSRQFEEERLPILNEKKRNGLEVETSETRRFSHQRSVRRLRSELHSVNQHSRPLPWRRSFRPSRFNGKEEIEERVLRWRASIYNRRLQALPLPSKNLPEQDTSRSSIFKEMMQCRIKPWIQRELRAILQDPDPSVIVHLATSLYMLSLEEKLKASSEHVDLEDKFVKQLRLFLQDHTNLFWHELRYSSSVQIVIHCNWH
ncbi:hypothetical protein IFM89_007186, partial [Coptis chinensis]